MNKKGILIIGAGGVSRVATVKCAMNIDTFEKNYFSFKNTFKM